MDRDAECQIGVCVCLIKDHANLNAVAAAKEVQDYAIQRLAMFNYAIYDDKIHGLRIVIND